MSEEGLSSIEQDSWKEIAEHMRTHIYRTLPLMPAMDMEELRKFSEAARSVAWLELESILFDTSIADRKESGRWRT
jgi:hypothetical protein